MAYLREYRKIFIPSARRSINISTDLYMLIPSRFATFSQDFAAELAKVGILLWQLGMGGPGIVYHGGPIVSHTTVSTDRAHQILGSCCGSSALRHDATSVAAPVNLALTSADFPSTLATRARQAISNRQGCPERVLIEVRAWPPPKSKLVEILGGCPKDHWIFVGAIFFVQLCLPTSMAEGCLKI